LSENPICVVCGARGADQVHHIIEAHVNPDLFFEQDNLASVCEECHKKVHAAYRRGIKAEVLFKNKLKEKDNE
jgi:5-methylcytosine-specific restriction endonuclease McrA